jgi:protein ImuB
MFAVLHIADFALHAVLRTEPARPNCAAALFTDGGKKSVVAAASPAARAAGVQPGMTAPQALARCPALIVRSGNHTAEDEARATLFAVAFTLSPMIEDTAPGVCTADLRGTEAGKTEAAARAAIATLAQHDLPATAGVARTPWLALYAAQVTTSFLHVVDEARFLSPLPLATAVPPPELAAILENWGLRTIGDFLRLPRDEIVRRFGAAGLALWRRANGGEARPLCAVIPPRGFGAAQQFEEPLETLEPLLFILSRFLDRLTLELTAAQLVASAVTLTLRLEDDTRHERHFQLPEPTADTAILLRTLHTHLESLRTAAAVTAVALEITPARPLVRQQGLFDTGLRDPHGFAETLARVAALVGSDRVGMPEASDTHRPDTVRLLPPVAAIPPPAAVPQHIALGLLLRRFRPPLPARLEFTAGRPTYVWTTRMSGEISACGPAWPTNGEWWENNRAWERTEWDITLAPGGLYRLLRTGDAWFIEGEYD